MKPFINVFETFGNSASSPFAVWQGAWMIGWKMLDAWQQAWLPLLSPRLPGSGLPLNPLALMPNVAVHDLADSMLKNSPFAALLPQVEARLTPVGAERDDAARLSMRIRMPGLPGTGADETLAVEALIARQQGRERAALGCLQGVGVVYPPAEALPAADLTVAKKTVMKKAASKKPAAAKSATEAAATVVRKPAARKPAATKAEAVKSTATKDRSA